MFSIFDIFCFLCKKYMNIIMNKVGLEALASENAFDLIGKQWMLITAGNKDKYNTMTASWGGLGWLWNRPVAFLFVRSERYTYEFLEANERVTLSFFTEDYRKALQICGSKSGRDIDKAKETGITPVTTESGSVTFAESRLALDCRKLFKSEMDEKSFIDKEIFAKNYGNKPGGSLHNLYVVEIENVYTK